MNDYYENSEPMDIDLSGLSTESVKDMDISYGDSADVFQSDKSENFDLDRFIWNQNKDFESVSDTRALIIKKYRNVNEKSMTSELQVKLFSALFVLLLSIIMYHVIIMKYSEDLNIEEFNKTLSTKVFGQHKAIATIIEALELKTTNKIIFFYGGTGVGKTYVSSLLLETIGLYSNIYHYTMPSFRTTFSSDIMLGLTFCKWSLIIVDDLTEDDMDVVNQINEVITKSEYLNKNITVILIFNCHKSTNDLFKTCDESYNSKLMNTFSEIKAMKTFVKFETLTQKHLRQCIEREIGTRKLNIKLDEIIPYFNVTLDGCKSVLSKMKYLNFV